MPFIPQLKSDPKIKLLETRIHHTLEISMERVVAHLKDAAKYPLPADGASVERAVYDLMVLLPDRKRKDFIKKFETNLAAGPAKRKQLYGDLEAIDFKSSKSVAEQVAGKKVAANMQITSADLDRYRGILVQHAAGHKPQAARQAKKKAVPAAIVPGTKLAFAVTDLTCSKTSEIRKDEVSMGAVFFDAAGTAIFTDPFFVGDFKKGDSINLGQKGNLFAINFDDSTGGVFPQTFVANLFLLEKDLLRDSDALSKFQKLLLILGPATLMVGMGLIVTSVATGNPVLFTIGLAGVIAGAGLLVVNKVLDFISDDVSTFFADVIVFDTLPDAGQVFNRVASFSLFNALLGIGDSKPGQYTANCKWEVV